MSGIVFILIGILFGVILAALLRKPANIGINYLKSRAPIIKKYWKFIAPFIVIVIAAYYFVWRYAYSSINFDLLNQFTTLLLAIFIGYIAFSEYGENKFDKLTESARKSIRLSEFKTAMIKLEEAHAIKPEERDVTGDLAELYLILGEGTKFEALMKYFRNNLLEKSDEIHYRYLEVLNPLLKEHMREARDKITELITYVNNNPDIRQQFNWSNDALASSEIFLHLSTNAQLMVTNIFAYLKRQLGDINESEFVSGKYDKKFEYK